MSTTTPKPKNSDQIDLEAENKEIVRRYRKLLRSTAPNMKDGDAQLIKKAFTTALDAHKDMRRKSGEPYIFHPIAVAQICVEEIGLGPTSVVSALLHDVVEDTSMELNDIKRMFGEKVTEIIDGLTKISGIFPQGSSQQAENFRKMLLTLSKDVRVILIKIADRLHNMRTLESMPRNSQLRIASETIYLYAPLAHRLGLYSIKSELEDLYLKHSEPDIYTEIDQKIKQTKTARDKFIKDFSRPIENELKKQKYMFHIKGRPKSIFSIWNKMIKQKVPFEEVYDLFAIRIIIDCPAEQEKAQCWQVYSVVTDFYKPNIDRLRDWVSTPKGTGYESLHTTVMSKSGQWVEVQIRSVRMDEIAEKGYAAHFKYKEQKGANHKESGLETWLIKVREMLENNDITAIEFVNDFRNNLFNDEVYVFTPKGELRTLPGNSTALDFAFEIHTQVGSHCLGAKVNQKLVPLSYHLQNGDQVEILTSSKQKPTEDWLKFVVTSKAIAKIKDSLREEKKRVALDGKEIVWRKLKQLKLEPTDELINQLRAYLDQKTAIDFYYLFGKGSADVSVLRKFKELKESARSEKIGHKEDNIKSFEKEVRKIRGVDGDMLLIGEDLDKIDYTLAVCCNPIPGDDVFGFVTVNEGIKIHRTTCPNAVVLMSNYGYRIIKAKWTSQQELAFLAGLHIVGTDRMGLVNDITKIISNELKVNMRSITLDSKDGLFDGRINLFVQNTDHLNRLIKKMQKVPGVVRVARFDYES